MSKRIIRLDPSSMEYTACPRLFQFKNRVGLVSKMGNAALDWGSAIHRAIAQWLVQRARGGLYDEVQIIDEAVEWYNKRMCDKTEPRSGANVRAALQDYFRHYESDSFEPLTTPTGEVAVELPFALPLYANEHTDVLLCGKIDSVGFIGGDRRLCFKDVQTSSSNKPASHMEEQLARPQFHVYAWVLNELGLEDESMPSQDYLPVVIDALYVDKKFPGATLSRSAPTIIESYMIERTMEFVRMQARQLASLPDDVAWPHNYNACHGKYRRCEFYDICGIPLESQQMPLDIMFNKREYNPATFDAD